MSKPGNGTPQKERRRSNPQSLRIRNLSAALTVDDLERSQRFWVEGVGFTVKERWEEKGKLLGVMLVAGTCSLGLSQDDWAKGKGRQKGVGFRLFAETTQDLDALAELMRSRGIEVEGPVVSPWGERTLSVTDPDGFKLTLSRPA